MQSWPLAEIIIVHWNPNCQAPVVPWPVRIITVPSEIHRTIEGHAKLPFFEYVAKNVGIRRSTGEWVLCTNGDDLFSAELSYRLLHEPLDEIRVYRTHRLDMDQAGRVFRVCEDAAGDFTMMHRDRWINYCKGYPEVCSADTIDTWMLDIATRDMGIVMWDSPTFHQWHSSQRTIWPSMAEYRVKAPKNMHDDWGLRGIELPETE